MLVYLLSRHGKLVSKEDLHREIWGDRIVSDDSLTHCLLDIRKAIGDSDRTMIRTVPRRGYIFEAECTVEPAATNGTPEPDIGRPRKLPVLAAAAIALLVAGGVALLASRLPSEPLVIYSNAVAVLPFEDTSPARDQQYLGDGLSEEVLGLLSHSPDLRVIARSSSFEFRDESSNIVRIRNALQVAYVLDGSVLRDGDRIVVESRLIDASDNSEAWVGRYEGRPEDVIDIEFDIAQNVLGVIAPNADASIVNPEWRKFLADELMLLARFYEQELREKPEVDAEMLQRTIELYEQATRADPDSALAHSRLASALLYAGAIDAAEAPAHRAAALNPNLSEVQDTLGEYYWLSGQPGAGAAWQRAIKLNPNNADALAAYGYWYWMQANNEGPKEYFQRALELDPLSLARHAALGEFLAHEARVEETREVIERITQRFDGAAACRAVARLYEIIGDLDLAIA